VARLCASTAAAAAAACADGTAHAHRAHADLLRLLLWLLRRLLLLEDGS
jgi:hypothetical protein